MQELRCLFALMVGSTRRFVDPSAAVELLREAFRTSEAQQVRKSVLLWEIPIVFPDQKMLTAFNDQLTVELLTKQRPAFYQTQLGEQLDLAIQLKCYIEF